MIKVLDLYYDLLNLYGENGNLRSIVYELERNNINVKVDYKSISDKFNVNDYDIIYIGCGSEDSLFIALEDIIKRKNDFKKYIEDKKYLFLTGNSMELFGKYIIDFDGKKHECLSIFDYTTTLTNKISYENEASVDRIVGEVIGTTNLIDNKIIGFQNRCGLIHGVKNPLFKVKKNYSNDEKSTGEGFVYNNTYATQIIGPLFIRNPYLLDYLLNNICKDKKLKYTPLEESTAKKAYKKYLENFIN